MKRLGITLGLFGFWLVLTGSLGVFNLALGAVLSVLLGVWAERALWGDSIVSESDPTTAVRFIAYVPWLVKEIVFAAIGVAEKALSPRMPIDPVLIVHHSPLRSTGARVTFANSITLTPGTLTVDLDEGDYVVHCLDEDFATGIESGDMERRIGRVFGE